MAVEEPAFRHLWRDKAERALSRDVEPVLVLPVIFGAALRRRQALSIGHPAAVTGGGLDSIYGGAA